MEASRDHDDEEHPAPILAAEPTDPPAINTIPDRYRLSQPQELSLNLHVLAVQTYAWLCRPEQSTGATDDPGR